MAAKSPFSLLICGSVISDPDAAYLSNLRTSLLTDPYLASVRDTITELPDLWSLLVSKEPALERVGADSLVHSLKDWIKADGSSAAVSLTAREASRNTRLAVLTVLSHVVEYTTYLNSVQGFRDTETHDGHRDAHTHVLQGVQDGGIQGLCIGLLSAIALACSADRNDIGKHASTSLRLALCVGAFVDLDESELSEPTVCLSTRWQRHGKGSEQGAAGALDSIISGFPKAYMGVHTDDCGATLTAPKGTAISLARHLEENGMVAKPIDHLHGRYHHSKHLGLFQKLVDICNSVQLLQFPKDSHPLAPVRQNDTGEVIAVDQDRATLHETALHCILVKKADWYTTMKRSVEVVAQRGRASSGSQSKAQVLSLGPIDCLPRSVLGILPGLQVTRPAASSTSNGAHYPAESIAIIGVSCRFSGSGTPEQFWDMIQAKRTDKSPLAETSGAFASAFFRKSPREAEYMDPQQRLGLHLAYEALESGGYFVPSPSTTDDVGCYLGISSCDYEDHVNARPPTAFSFTGTARAFASGRISHFFGLTGPSMIVDTACSSSAVAIHTACRAIQSGECAMALAGGINLITPEARSNQNLGAAGFLGQAGQCRPFDASADGYSRGEGGGFVLLKKLSSAVADNDRILGVIAATAINNSKGTRSITLPSSESQTRLYQMVLEKAGMLPHQVSYVEAHGTGTQKGDPVECQSIRNVFGNCPRPPSSPLQFGSVKGNLGHLEAASGVAGLVKVLLMLQHGIIPPQANFSALNPSIPPLQDANMAIPTTTEPWEASFRAALVNNYGASGTNAALVVCQPPQASTQILRTKDKSQQYPFLLTAHSVASLHQYSRVLSEFIETQEHHGVPNDKLLRSIAFQLAQRQNQSLGQRVLFTASSIDELRTGLFSQLQEENQHGGKHVDNTKPVVLLFAGQTGRQVRLSREAYLSSNLLQYHLDQCNRTMQTLGLHSIFPRIFDPQPIEDLVDLHCIIFALQYSAASSWIDSGLKVDSIVGHSLGQLTALCVSGSLSLRDALKMVSGRAMLIQDHWSKERGCMLSVEGDTTTVESLISQTKAREGNVQDTVEIACYNSSSHHVVAGTEAAIGAFEREAISGDVPVKRLSVTHGFHSELASSIIPRYRTLLRELELRSPTIKIEPCSKSTNTWSNVTSEMIANQSREPVFFTDAISRVEKRLGPCIWLEAGSGSAGVTMARRALAGSVGENVASSGHRFYSVRLGEEVDPMKSLTDTTLGLWSEGVKVQFWLYHSLQRSKFLPLELPPYQFETTEHWLSFIPREAQSNLNDEQQTTLVLEEPPKLVSLVGKQTDVRTENPSFEFTINQNSEEYSSMVQGRTVLGHTLAPTSMYIESAARAFGLLPKDVFEPSVKDVSYASVQVGQVKLSAPFGLDQQRRLRLTLCKHAAGPAWDFTVESHMIKDKDLKSLKLQASGTIQWQLQEKSSYLGSSRPILRRLYDRGEELQSDRTASIVQGSFVQKMLAPFASYDDGYFGIQSVISKNLEAVGGVTLPNKVSRWHAETAFKPMTFDNFLIVAELHAGTLGELEDEHLYICNGFDAVRPQSHPADPKDDQGPWMVLSNLDWEKDKSLVGDIFVFSESSKKLHLSILGAQLKQIPTRSLQRTLQAVNSASPVEDAATTVDEPKTKVTVASSEALPHLTANKDTSRPIFETTRLFERRQEKDIDISLGWDAQHRSSPSPSTRSSTEYTKDLLEASPNQYASSTSSVSSDGLDQEQTDALLGLISDHLNCSQEISPDTPLGTIGLDSLVAIQLQADMEKVFGKRPSLKLIDENSTLSDLSMMISDKDLAGQADHSMFPAKTAQNKVDSNEGYDSPQRVIPAASSASRQTSTPFLAQAVQQVAQVKRKTTKLTEEAGFSEFFSREHKMQTSLVLAYILEAFKDLGCDLEALRAGEVLPPIAYEPKYHRLVPRLHEILEEAGLIASVHGQSLHRRTAKPVPRTGSSAQLYRKILTECPNYTPDHELLNVTASRLADCLSGRADPLKLLFQDAASLRLLEDVYVSSPMFATGNRILGEFLRNLISNIGEGSEKLRILEIGAGTGATTRRVLDVLLQYDVDFTYTFTDVSLALVASSKKKIGAHYKKQAPGLDIEFMALDIEKPPPEEMQLSYDLIISSNCIHATKDLRQSCGNMERLLRRDGGMLCLLELTRPLAWLDCVFGLLDGWWRFSDDRTYALASEHRWRTTLLDAGFGHVDWTDDGSRESQQFRMITAWREGI